MKGKYYDQAVACVKDYVLPAQRELYTSCGGDFDKVYGEAMNGNGYFGKVIMPGHVYELGYEKCTCEKVLSGQITDPDHCNCIRQSILYILSHQESDSEFERDVIALAKGMGKKAVRLDALACNAPAHRLYESLGFKKRGVCRWYAENTGWFDFYLFECLL